MKQKIKCTNCEETEVYLEPKLNDGLKLKFDKCLNCGYQMTADDYSKLSVLDEKGFVVINNKPYWFAMRYGKPMIAYWNYGTKTWVNLKEASQTEIDTARKRALSDDQAEMYHKQHRIRCGKLTKITKNTIN